MPLESYTQADIQLTERRRLETPLLLLIWMGCLGFSLAEENLFYLVSSTLAVGVNWFAARRNKVVYINRWFVNIGVIIATLIVIAEYSRSGHSVFLTLGHYIILIQLCKLFEKKKSRDYIQLLVLNLLLLLCTALITAHPLFGFWTIAYIVLACYVAMVFTLKRGLDHAAEVKLHGELGPLSPRRVAWNVSRYWPSKTIRRAMLVTLVPSLIMGVVVFILAPRNSEKMSGLSEQFSADYDPNIKLGRSREIYLSDRIVMTLQIIKGGKPSLAQSQASKYMRLFILDQYMNSTWSRSQNLDRRGLSMPVVIDETLTDKLVTQNIHMPHINQPELAAPYTTVNIESADNNISVSRNNEFIMEGPIRPLQSFDYKTSFFPTPLETKELAFLRKVGRVPKASARPSRSVQLTYAAQSKVLGLAESWCEDLLEKRKVLPELRSKFNLAIAQRIAENLRLDYSYTLDLTEADPNIDAVEDFLFYLKKGHCEYFASTMAVMCNLLEVPTHVATGFLLEEYDTEKNEYIVRNRDAHAWCEVYTPETGWEIIDPTSGTARTEAIRRSWWTFMSDYVDQIRFLWYEKVVGYDFNSQKSLSEEASSQAKDLWQKTRKYMSSLFKSLRKSLDNLIINGEVDLILVKLLAGMTVVSVLIFFLLLLRMRKQEKQQEQADMFKKLKLLYRFLAMLHKQGLPYHPDLTLREKLYSAAEQFDLPLQPLEELINLQYRWRWGGVEPTAKDIRTVRQNFVALCVALDAASSTPK